MKKQSKIFMHSFLLACFFALAFINNNAIAQTVVIGSQTWSTQNLDVTTYRNGDVIPQVQDAEAWKNLTTGAWCYYENKTSYGTTYGKLYNWYAVTDSRGLAPQGFHVPTDVEWNTLSGTLSGDAVAGNALKSVAGWDQGGNGTNASGFSGMPGGYRFNNGSFTALGVNGVWWSSSESNTTTALYRSLKYANGGFSKVSYNKQLGLSVRCIAD